MSLKEDRYETHTVYTKADFTAEEITRKNLLAVAVLESRRLICKCCGREDAELYNAYCRTPKNPPKD